MWINKSIRGWRKRTHKQSLKKAVLEVLESRCLLSVNVPTWHNDLTRQGLNNNEAVLTPANVNTSTFGELLSYSVTGQVYAQPLYLSNLAIPGKGTHNVIFVATENNDVYAFDANSNAGTYGGLLWHVNLGLAAATPNSFFGNRYGPYHDINPQVGITSTPVIDLASGTMYVDAFTNDVAGQDVYSHHIHALDVTTGQEKIAPMLVSAAMRGNGVGGDGTTITFSAEQQLQRPALTLLNGVLYVAYSGFADTDPYHGWVLGFNSTTLQLVSVLNDTPNLVSTPASSTADEGGIWQCGAGLASDGSNMFLLVGNGDFNAALGDYGDSVLKLATDSSTPANPNINGYGLKVADYFTPYNQLALSNADEDLGSGGGIVLPDQPGPYPHEFIGSGKQGVIYVINRDNMGQYNSSTDTVIQKVNIGHGNWDSPAYFNETIYYHAVGDVLKGYSLTNGLLSPAPAEQSVISYSGQGATPSISSNGTANGIVWDVQYDSSHQVLHAYDATTLAELYNSNQNIARDQMGAGVKFITPTIADGEVIVGSSNALTIYGLLTPPTTVPAAPTTLTVSAASASSITLNWVNNANNQAGFKIERSTGNASNFAQIAIASANATSFIDSTVSASTLYYYRVRATNIIGDSNYTNTVNVTTPAVTGAIDLYHFDEGTGTTAVDSVGGNNSTLIGGTLPQWITPGKIGAAALAFSGDGTYNQAASQSAVKVANDLSPVLGSTSTLDVWINTLQVGNATHWKAPAITGVEQSGGANDINWGTLDASGHIGIYVGDAGGVYSTNPINDGHWHNVAMTRDATSGKVQIFVDGVLTGTGTFDTGNKTSQFFLIGALSDVAYNGTTRTGDNYFNGRLDEVRIYNQVLSADEITGLATIPAAPTLVSATAASGSVVQITWTVPSNYTEYIEVDRKTGANGNYAPIITLAGSTTGYMDQNLIAGVQYYYEIKAIDLAGTSPASNELSVTPPLPTIVGNYIFYNNSVFDGHNGSSNLTDYNAIAKDKSPLLPNQAATFANYTSYINGINGIIIDVANLPTAPTADDFEFAVGNDNNINAWAPAPDPTYVNTYPGRGPGGSTQITLIWDDGAIVNQWLQVTMLANQVTGLAADDVFYFGNAIGETGDSNTDALVTANDAECVSANQTNTALVTNPYDINRDGIVNAEDVSLVNSHLTPASNGLKLISLSPPTVATPASASPNPVTGTTTALHVLGADIAGESSLTYTWSTTGTPPANVTFSDNNSNSAKNTIATFTKAGNYSFDVIMTDAGGSTVISNVDVIVDQSLASLTVTPGLTTVAGGTTQQFSIGSLDQFNQPMVVSPIWSVSGGGTISVDGLFTANQNGGSYNVTASSGSVIGSATVSVVPTDYTGSPSSDTWIVRLNPADNSLEQIYVNASTSASPTYQITLSQLPALSFNPDSSGDDTLTIDFSVGSPIPFGGVNFNGGTGGGDTLIIAGAAIANDITMTSSQISDNGSIPINYSNTTNFLFNLGSGKNNLSLNGATLNLSQDNAISAGTNVTVNGGTLDLNGKTDTIGDLLLKSGSVLNGTLYADSYSIESGTVTAAITGPGILQKTTTGQATMGVVNTSNVTVDAGQLIATSINTGTLTIGLGSTLTIAALPGGPLAANSTLTPLSIRTLRPNQRKPIAELTAVNTIAPSTSASTAVAAGPIAASTVLATPAPASSEVASALASSDSLSNTVLDAVAVPTEIIADTALPVSLAESTPARRIDTAINGLLSQSPFHFQIDSMALPVRGNQILTLERGNQISTVEPGSWIDNATHNRTAPLQDRLRDAVFAHSVAWFSLMEEDCQPDDSSAPADIETFFDNCLPAKSDKSFARAIDTLLAAVRHKKD